MELTSAVCISPSGNGIQARSLGDFLFVTGKENVKMVGSASDLMSFLPH